MAIFAYGRVSTKEKTADKQRINIEAAGHQVDSASLTLSAEWAACASFLSLPRCWARSAATVKLLVARKNLVIVPQLGKLDLALWVGKIMLTILAAELERDVPVERTHAGLARAKSEGRTLCRPSKTTPAQRSETVSKYHQRESVSVLARQFAVSRPTILRW